MSDVIQKTTKYRIKQIELAEAKYYKSLITVLDRIETQVTALASRDLPIQDGKLIELQSAIAIRPKIKQILDTEYLPLADQIVRDGFNEQAKRIEKAFQERDVYSAEALVLGSDFFNSTIHFHPSG